MLLISYKFNNMCLVKKQLKGKPGQPEHKWHPREKKE